MSNQATAKIYRTGEVTDYMSISTVEHGGTWRVYKGPVQNAIDCIRIREALSGFHLEYRTWNEGVGKYYPYVNSEDDSADSYAGLAGKAIQRVNIVAYDDNNNKVDTGIVVMYRARVDGTWLPWVSNANAASMQSVQEKYGGMDDLDTTSGYAGISGKNMDGFQIRVFVEQPIGGNTGGASDPSQGNFNGSEVNLTLSYMKDNESNWVGFNKSAFPGDYIDGIKIQTSASDEFYLSYKTKAAGSGDYFSAVLSTDSSQYAGLPGRHIQRLSISAYDKGGNKLDKGVVIMYRAYVDSKWLPWVSNAAPDWMENVWNTFDLPGTLDTSSGYAGVDGKDIKGVEIRAFVGNNINGSLTGLLGMEVSPTSSRYLVGNQWYSFHKKVEASRIDGIEIKTDPNKSYYLSYQTQNEGKSTFYPAVTSLENDYAGYPNKAVQTVGIRVFTNDGAKVDSGVVVMLRTKTGGRWLPWVSNADPEWMRSVQRKYGLNLTLDTSSYEAGIQGQNIEGIEVRIFEETGIYAGAQTPAGKTKIIKNVPFIYQMNDWPTGCESVSTVMALNHAGNSMTVDTFINNYLDKQPYPFDPDETFGGDPTETENSFGCYAPVIKKALDKALANTEYHATQLSNMSMLSLCSQYIDNDIPVIMWATMEMREAYISRRWTYNGKVIQWIAPEHCLLLVGYTDTQYIFNDPLAHKQTYYGKAVVENAYEAFSRQAIVVRKNEAPVEPESPYEYGAVQSPETGEIYPIKFYPNPTGGPTFSPVYNLVHFQNQDNPIRLGGSSFNLAKFIAGFSMDDEFLNFENPVLGGVSAFLVTGLTTLENSIDSLYLDVSFLKTSDGLQKKAVINCGNSQYYNTFKNWDFSLKTKKLLGYGGLHSPSNSYDYGIWFALVQDIGRRDYEKYKGVTLPNNCEFNIEYTFNVRRQGSRYCSVILFGKDNTAYEYANFTNDEKVEIVVTGAVNDRLNILDYAPHYQKVPDEIANRLTFLTDY